MTTSSTFRRSSRLPPSARKMLAKARRWRAMIEKSSKENKKTRPIGFLDLPAELRNMIYAYSMTTGLSPKQMDEMDLTPFSRWSYDHSRFALAPAKPPASLLLANKQIAEEARSVSGDYLSILVTVDAARLRDADMIRPMEEMLNVLRRAQPRGKRIFDVRVVMVHGQRYLREVRGFTLAASRNQCLVSGLQTGRLKLGDFCDRALDMTRILMPEPLSISRFEYIVAQYLELIQSEAPYVSSIQVDMCIHASVLRNQFWCKNISWRQIAALLRDPDDVHRRILLYGHFSERYFTPYRGNASASQQLIEHGINGGGYRQFVMKGALFPYGRLTLTAAEGTGKASDK